MVDTLGVGIMGCGNISATYLKLGPLFKGIEMRAVADIIPEAAQTLAADHEGIRALTVDEMYASDEIDVIINLTIPDVHYAVTKRILESGKHAYSEKPLVLNLEDGQDLLRLSKEKNLRIGCTPDTFLGGAHQMARKLIDEGAIGKVTAGVTCVMSHGMEYRHPNPGFFFQPGGGPVMDVGPYYIANLINLLGPVKRVTSMTSSATPTRTIATGPKAGQTVPVDTPTNIHALLEFHNGATITLLASWDVWKHNIRNMELYGTEGSLFVPDPNFFGGKLEMAGTDGVTKTVDMWDHPLGVVNLDGGALYGQLANYRASGLAEMVAAISQNREHRCTVERALHGVDVMTSILKAGELGEFVDIKTTCERAEPLEPEEAATLMK